MPSRKSILLHASSNFWDSLHYYQLIINHSNIDLRVIFPSQILALCKKYWTGIWKVLYHKWYVLICLKFCVIGYFWTNTGGFGSYLLGMSDRIAIQSEDTNLGYKNLSLTWIIGFLFVVSFLGLFSVVPLRKVHSAYTIENTEL